VSEEDLEKAFRSDRRTFIKRLVAGTAFAAPIVSSFTLAGVEAVFGSKRGSAGALGPNTPTTTTPPTTTPPSGVPDPPTNVTATLGSVIVSWTPPGNQGSSPIASYVVTASTGQTYTAGGNATTITIVDLGPGTYTFTVRAVNAAGSSIASAPSNAVTVTDPAQAVQANPRFIG